MKVGNESYSSKKIPRSQGHAGSSPALSTMKFKIDKLSLPYSNMSELGIRNGFKTHRLIA